MDKGHRKECRRNDWCFLCELQCHLERVTHQQPFSPLNNLSRLPSIGGNLGYGKQEDAHEFMRYAIDTMQSICLDENGGEELIHSKYQETTLIQHIFGGQLQSQVICTQCNQVLNQYENMMDLTVEIQGDSASLEECLDQFTVKEYLHGDNLYKCDGPQNAACGIVHSIDIHPSRKHTCMAGGSSGTVFAWDLRWQQQPIILSGVGITERGFQSPSETEVWEVQYDSYTQSSHISSLSSSRTLPVMMCSADGILAVIEKGMGPIELLAEPCAINSLDIDKQNHIISYVDWNGNLLPSSQGHNLGK